MNEDPRVSPDDETVQVPTEALRMLVDVAAHVSLGRGAAFISRYPDALARRALGALDDAGLLDEVRAREIARQDGGTG